MLNGVYRKPLRSPTAGPIRTVILISRRLSRVTSYSVWHSPRLHSCSRLNLTMSPADIGTSCTDADPNQPTTTANLRYTPYFSRTVLLISNTSLNSDTGFQRAKTKYTVAARYCTGRPVRPYPTTPRQLILEIPQSSDTPNGAAATSR